MFPLGTVLLPGVALPLHVFEPRYRALMRACLRPDTSPEFGVVLIERGSEVGGGDVRTAIGCIARIVDATELPDGRWILVVVGTERVRVLRWLDDDPYPRADVELWPEKPATLRPGELDRLAASLRRVMALRTELGEPALAATLTLPSDPVAASYAASAIAPLGPIDRQRLIEAPGPDARVELLQRLLDEELVVLERRIELLGEAGDTDE
jgi:Lon protease-like protein